MSSNWLKNANVGKKLQAVSGIVLLAALPASYRSCCLETACASLSSFLNSHLWSEPSRKMVRDAREATTAR